MVKASLKLNTKDIRDCVIIIRDCTILIFGAILCRCPCALLWACKGAYDYFHADFETAVKKGFKRPVIGLKLCKRCKALRHRSGQCKVNHHPDLQTLNLSAENGCWLCQQVFQQYQALKVEHENPHELVFTDTMEESRFTQFGSLKLLRWICNEVKTKSGYLDLMGGNISYPYRIYGDHQREIHPDPLSPEAIGIANSWLGVCEREHNCYQGDFISLPTRVIDVSKEPPRLCISHGASAPYITLSHRWGDASTLTTTKSTIAERMVGIPMEDLPKLFRDTVTVTRLLKIDYLWIDSLCIIQDSNEDWVFEAARMGDIYRRSFLTIFALDARNSYEGVSDMRSNSSTSDLTRLRPREEYFQNSPLCKRGWALQERLLSTRILYYTKNEMLWECLRCAAREGSHRATAARSVPYYRERYECNDVKRRLIIDAGPDPSLPLSPPEDWHKIIVEYTRCQLARLSDKLPALSGLAAVFQEKTGFTYLAGLWKEDICGGLLWYAAPSSKTCQSTHHGDANCWGPSWSWTSTNIPVAYATVVGRESAPVLGIVARHDDLELVSSSISHLDMNPMGTVTNASIGIRALTKSVYLTCPHTPYRSCRVFEMDVGRPWGTMVLDRPDHSLIDEKSDGKIPCVAVWICKREIKSFNVNRPSEQILYFLVVTNDMEQPGTFRRIGLGQTTDYGLDYWDSDKKDLTLV